jgi:hypothetical protein
MCSRLHGPAIWRWWAYNRCADSWVILSHWHNWLHSQIMKLSFSIMLRHVRHERNLKWYLREIGRGNERGADGRKHATCHADSTRYSWLPHGHLCPTWLACSKALHNIHVFYKIIFVPHGWLAVFISNSNWYSKLSHVTVLDIRGCHVVNCVPRGWHAPGLSKATWFSW